MAWRGQGCGFGRSSVPCRFVVGVAATPLRRWVGLKCSSDRSGLKVYFRVTGSRSRNVGNGCRACSLLCIILSAQSLPEPQGF